MNYFTLIKAFKLKYYPILFTVIIIVLNHTLHILPYHTIHSALNMLANKIYKGRSRACS